MAKEPREFEISKLLEITRHDKYATAVAAFEVIDQAERLDIPKKWKTRKPAVQAMMALSDDMIRYGFISDDVRQQLREELYESGEGEAPFMMAGAAPVTDESEEDLDEIGETEPVEALADADSESDDSEEEEDEEDSEDDEEEEEDSDDEEEEED